MRVNDTASEMDKMLETAVCACRASLICSLYFEARGSEALAEQWRQETAKAIHYMCRDFPLDAVIRVCDEIDMSKQEVMK